MALGGNKATRNTSQILPFFIFAELWNSKMIWGEKIQTNAVMTVSGLILFLDLINTNPQKPPPAANTQRTHWSPKWALWRALVGRRTQCFIYEVFSTIKAVLKSEENTIFVFTMVDHIWFSFDKIKWSDEPKHWQKGNILSNWEGTLPRPNSQTAA